jgi:hypothetical protein
MGRGLGSTLLILAALLAPLAAPTPGRATIRLQAAPADSTRPAHKAYKKAVSAAARRTPPPTPPVPSEEGQKREKPAKSAKSPSSPRSLGPFSLSGSFDFQYIYDSNIFRYSDFNIHRIRIGDFNPGEFKLDTVDDYILSPKLTLNFGMRLVGSKESVLRFSYVRWQYVNNPDKSNEAWAVRLRQPTIGRDFLELGYTYAPMAYIRQLGDRAPFEPYSNFPYAYYPFNSARNTFLFAYQRRLSARLTGRFEGGRVIRYYNQRFIENDNWEWNAAGIGIFSLTPAWKITGKYTYSDVPARGADIVGQTIEQSNTGDPSYKRDLYQATFDFGPRGGFLWDSQWELSGQYMAYYYTSKKPFWEDATHVGRKDEVYALESTLGSKALWRSVTGELGYRYTERRSSSTTAGNLEEDKNYHNYRIWLGTSYPF